MPMQTPPPNIVALLSLMDERRLKSSVPNTAIPPPILALFPFTEEDPFSVTVLVEPPAMPPPGPLAVSSVIRQGTDEP